SREFRFQVLNLRFGIECAYNRPMPLFEYQCLECEKTFEEIVLGDTKPRCPACESRKLRKLLSAFAVGSGSPSGKASSSEASGGCGSCGDPRGPGSCSMN
ncbi:MAG TPA: zinc ribbon domain-containing protein, partial [Thermoanaerobaculia bacterium]